MSGNLLFLSIVYVWRELIRGRKINPVNKNYHRNNLAEKPAFDVIIGNLNECVQTIEKFFLEKIGSDERKETMPFLVVVNPPRHGKSLLLDRLFLDHNDVIVIPITYNSNTTLITDEELKTTQSALRYFWLRVLKSLCGSSMSLLEFDKTVDTILSFHDMMHILERSNWVPSAFFKEDGKRRHILICVDEFTKLTDAMTKKISDTEDQYWTKERAIEFTNKLHSSKQLNPFFVQYVFTGFTQNFRDLVDSSGKVYSEFSLTMCDYSSAKPLLSKIIERYHSKPFPMLLFQSIKMTPGLVGQWAEFVRDDIYVENITAFRSRVAWLWKISEDSVIEQNWELLFKYLSVWEIYQQLPESREFIDLEERLVDAQIYSSIKGGVGGRLHMVPACFVLIAQCYRGSLHQELKTLLEELFMSIANYKSDANAKNGDSFETFALYALQLRVYLRANSNSSWTLHELFGGKVYHLTKADKDCLLHIVSSKQELCRFLLAPIYFLFPVDFKTLEKPLSPVSSVSEWVKQLEHSSSSFNCKLITEEDCRPLEITRSVGKDSCKLVVALPKSGEKDKTTFLSLIEKIWKFLNGSLCYSFSFNEIENKDPLKTVLSTFLQTEMALDEEIKKALLSFWEAIINQVLIIVGSIRTSCSFLKCNSGKQTTEGLDLLILWKSEQLKEETQDIETIEDMKSQVEYHIAALELKDRRNTTEEEWQKKLDSLFSYRCVLWWIKALFKKEKIQFHIVLAGREETTD